MYLELFNTHEMINHWSVNSSVNRSRLISKRMFKPSTKLLPTVFELFVAYGDAGEGRVVFRTSVRR